LLKRYQIIAGVAYAWKLGRVVRDEPDSGRRSDITVLMDPGGYIRHSWVFPI
jgi:hypothetical protein